MTPPVRKKPVVVTPEIGEAILDELATGRSLTSICQGEHMPTAAAVVILARRDPDFGEAYEFARRCGAELRGDRLLDKGDSAIGLQSMAEVQGIRVSADIDKWYLAKMHPERWGEHLDVRHQHGVVVLVPDNGRLNPGVEVIDGTAVEQDEGA